jgi:hypothetical protein
VRVFRKPYGAAGAAGAGGEEERWRGGEWAPRPGAWRAWWLRSLADAVRGAAARNAAQAARGACAAAAAGACAGGGGGGAEAEFRGEGFARADAEDAGGAGGGASPGTPLDMPAFVISRAAHRARRPAMEEFLALAGFRDVPPRPAEAAPPRRRRRNARSAAR